jgi:APA family basic amino acid/polyamine antiporter
MSENTTGLKKGVNLPAVVALGLGTAVGVAIFSVIAPATAIAGPGMLIAVPIAAVPMFIIAVSYAFLGSALPTSGASYEWPRRFLHPFAAFLISWLRIAGTTSALLVLALVMTRYLAMAVPIERKPTMLIAFGVVFAINFFGVKLAGRILTFLVAAMVLLFLAFSAWGAAYVEPANFQPFLPHGWDGVLAAIPLLVSLFLGIETAAEVGDEIENGKRNLPLGIAIAIAAAVALYLIVGAVTIGVMGAPALAASDTPILDAAVKFMGPIAKPLVVTAAVIATGKSLNGVTMVFSRYLYAMGRSGVLPSALGRVHPTFGTPYVALMVVFCLCALGLLLPSSLTLLFLAVNIPTLLMYGAASLSAARVCAKHPELYEAAGLKLGRGVTWAWSYLSVLSALGLVALGVTTDWRPYAALGAWAVIGLIYYALRRPRMRAAAADPVSAR